MPLSIHDPQSDSISPACELVLSTAPALSAALVMQAIAQAMANAAHNATYAQQQLQILAQAVTTMCVSDLLSVGDKLSAPAQAQ